jgi:N6-adenosine-specific RNA methylase IME4
MRRVKQIRRIDETPLPEGLFRTIVVDPPWEYEDATCRGAAENIYPTLSFTEVCRLPIAERAAPECHLFLWVTNPHVDAAFDVIRRWGFTYKILLTWVKPRMGLGRYFRGATEHILFATRGKLLLREQNIKNCFDAPGGAHSEKPEAFYQIVEKACFGPYLELFARRNRPGWICWGAELDGPIHQTAADVNTSGAGERSEASS